MSRLTARWEVDEVFIGGKPRRIHGTRHTAKRQKTAVVGLLERNGRVRPKVVADVTGDTLKGVISENVERSARIMTDDWSGYRGLRNAGELTDGERTVAAIKAAQGKRLTYAEQIGSNGV